MLRDSAMVKEGEDDYFQDTSRHTTFHANNLWVDLRVVDRLLRAERRARRGGPRAAGHRQPQDGRPRDPGSTPVIQIETAMGAAVERIEGARALFVPRTRFRPVKTTNELLLVRSDIFELAADSTVVSVIDHPEPYVDLDKPFKLVPGFEQRFATGCPRCARPPPSSSRATCTSGPTSWRWVTWWSTGPRRRRSPTAITLGA